MLDENGLRAIRIRRIVRTLVAERAALLAVVYAHATPELLAALAEYFEQSVRSGSGNGEHRTPLIEACPVTLH